MDRSIGDMPTLSGGDERSWKGILQPGSLFGRYKVCRFLGRGGMGEVYEVEHELDGAHYAMKVLSSEIPQTPENIRRFEREAQVMARLQHPNVISVDYFDETNGKYWFRMELVHGIEEGVVTLGDLAEKNGGRIGQGLLVCLFEHILDGLSCAHEKGVIHRDLKPSNILLAHSDEVAGSIVPKISDFGLVRLVGQDWLLKKTLLSAHHSLEEGKIEGTMGSQGLSTQSLVGTYAYMSPEQKERKQVDERSDIYAVGLIIYRLLTGYTNPGEKIRNKDSTLHAFWQRIIDQSVREDPKDRFASAAAMLVEIQRGHRVLASLDGKALLQKCRAEFQAKRHYTANRYLDEAAMIFPDDPEVLGFRALMREQLGILHGLKSKMQDLRHQKMYDEALTVSEQFRAICIEDEDINKFIHEFPQLATREKSRQFIEEASRLLEAEQYEAADRAAIKALSLDPQNKQAERIHDLALTTLKKIRMQHTREQVNKGLHKTYVLLRQKHYAEALDTLKHTPCFDSNHPKVIALRNACQAGLEQIRQYMEQAEKARASSDYQRAISLLDEVLRDVAPEDPGTTELLNRLKREIKELSTALSDMDRAWKNKSYRECLTAADRILAIQPQHAKAQQYKLVCRDKIQFIQSYIDEAEKYYQNQQYDEAIAAFEQTKKHYDSGKHGTKDDTELKLQHGVSSPEYKEILDRIAAIRKAKTSMEQALQRAKERLEAGDLLETRLALNDYFKLQTNGAEGLSLQRKLASLHRHATMMIWIRRSAIYFTVAAVVGLALAYGMASLVVSHRMQKELERSCSALTLANLKEMQETAGIQLTRIQKSRLIPFFSVKAKWETWKETLDNSEPAWQDYARGAYEAGRKKLENIPLQGFRTHIQYALDTFEQDTNKRCTDANDQLVQGNYDACISDCDIFLLNYPQHKPVLDFLSKAKGAMELERRIYDPNIDLIRLSDHIRDLIKISPRYHDRQKLDEHCIQRVESQYSSILQQPLPEDINAIEGQEALCIQAFNDLALFKECHGYDVLYDRLTKRREGLKVQLTRIGEKKDFHSKLAEAKSLIETQYWGKAKQILDTFNPAQDEVLQLQNIVTEKFVQLDDLIKQADEQAKQQNWLIARIAINKVWIYWKRDDTCDLLQKAKDLETYINSFLQEQGEVIREFVKVMDQKDHDEIEQFIRDGIGHSADLTLVYDKWFPMLSREVQEALTQNKITTALNLLSRVLNNESITRKANEGDPGRFLQALRMDQKLAEGRSNRASQLTDDARSSQSNRNYPEALWHVHQALEMNRECDSARRLQATLQSAERLATQNWREAKSLYNDKCYFFARLNVERLERDFPGDLRVIALSRDLDAKIDKACQATADVLARKISVKEYYDTFVDSTEFGPESDQRIKKAILKDLISRIADRSYEQRRAIIIAARERCLQDETEYQDLRKKYGSGTMLPLLSSVNIPNADWCPIKFDLPPNGADITIQIEGHDLKAPNTAIVRCQDNVCIQVSSSSNPDCSRREALTLEPWKVYQVKIKPSWSRVKTAEVHIVNKGWMLFKEFDWDAMADQVTKAYRIDKSQAKKSLQLALDQVQDKKDITTLQVSLIGCWQDEQFVEIKVEK